ncbi:MAG: hypothetical protein VXX53_09980 [Pseudomonadota bacterium]|nr:hypothetical protein [Pseudomonadota bacterium]
MKNAKALTLAGAVALAVTFAASTAMAGNCWSHGQKDTTAETTKPKPKTKKDGANAKGAFVTDGGPLRRPADHSPNFAFVTFPNGFA